MAGTTTTVHDIFQTMEYGPAATSNTATAQAWLDKYSHTLGLFIDGKFVHPPTRQTRSLMDSKGVVCSTLCALQDDISQCASSALRGFEAWSSSLSCYHRSKVLLRLASVLGQHGQCLSELCDLCQVPCSSSTLLRMLQYYTGWAQLRDTLIGNWSPLGVVLVVVSDDCTFYSLMLKVLPAIAMGNSVIVVPGRRSAPPVLLLAQLFMSGGFPAGVLNVLTGSDMSLATDVAKNPAISFVTYSGNKQDGVKLCKATAGMGVPVSVTPNIGPTCPIIIFESADIDSAIDDVIGTAFMKNKEVHWVLCVQESVHDSVVARLRVRMAGLKCVALPSDEARLLVDTAVQDAQNKGVTLVQSSAVPCGAQYPPTVLCGAAPSLQCVVSPSPGPLLPLMTFRSNTEAVTLGNHSPHGQAACIWTEDLTLALETSKSLSVGSVWVNSHPLSDPCLPASGHKDSGTCTDGGQEGLYQFLRPSSYPVVSRTLPVALDYGNFGSDTSQVIIPDETASTLKYYTHYIGGKACKSESGAIMELHPRGGSSVLGYCPNGGRKDVRNAVEAAIKVQPGWMKKSPMARAQSIQSLAKGLEGKRNELATSILQSGISLDHANVEVNLSIERLSDWAAYCDKMDGRTLHVPQSGSGFAIPEALGVVGVVLPDKQPLLAMVTLLGAALASGNAIVVVPSQESPLPALSFIQVLLSSDLPPGLVNIITGRRDQLTKALANHSVIKAIWYWGNNEGCQYLQHSCTSPLKTLRLFCQTDKDGNHSGLDWHNSVLEDWWRNSVQWKSVWIPTA
ncbi:aldehyde dehydrogenase family 16 member A1 [Stigmatopora argus]